MFESFHHTAPPLLKAVFFLISIFFFIFINFLARIAYTHVRSLCTLFCTDDESSHGVHITKMGSEDVHFHVQHEHGTGGHWCAKIFFFSLLAILFGLVGLIILEHRGISDCKYLMNLFFIENIIKTTLHFSGHTAIRVTFLELFRWLGG